MIAPFLLSARGQARFCGASVTLAADQTAANYSGTAVVPFDSEFFDTDDWHSNSVTNSRLIVPAGRGITKVLVIANIYTSNNANTLFAYIGKNGAYNNGVANTSITPTSNSAVASLSTIYPCVDGDYFDVALTTADTSITVVASNSNFNVVAIG